MSQKHNRILFLLVQYEDGNINPPKYSIVEDSRLVPPPVGDIGELFVGKLVHVGTLNGSRRSKLLSMSENHQTLQNELRLLEGNTFENYQMESNLDELENTIKNLQKTLERYRQTIQQSKRNNRHNPYDNPTPSTSRTIRIRSNTTERVSSNTNDFNNYASYNSPRVLPDGLDDIGRSLTDLSRHVRYLEERLNDRQESKVNKNEPKVNARNRRILVTPSVSTSSDSSYGVQSELLYSSDEECEKVVNNRSIPRNSSVVKNGKPIESVNFEEGNNTEETPKNNKNSRPVSPESGDEDTVRIGPGRTEVSRHVMRQLDWTSHTLATRKLLTAVFPRKVLATHSLTGKSSPAFTNKPAKLCLDPVRVQDIIITVTKKCQVKENLVRNAITTKCADENKMYRTREAKKKQNKEKKENCDPKNNSGSSSSAATNNGVTP